MTHPWKPSLAQKRILRWLYVHDGDTFGSWTNGYERMRPGQIHEVTLLILEKEGVIRPCEPRNPRILTTYAVYELTDAGQRVVGAMLADGLPTPSSRGQTGGEVVRTRKRGAPDLLTSGQERALVRTGDFVHALNMPGSVRLPGGVNWRSFVGLAERGMVDMREHEMQSTVDALRDRQAYSDEPIFLMTTRGLSYFYGLTGQPAWLYRVWVAMRGVAPLEHATGLDIRQAYDMVAELNANRSQEGILHAFYERI